MLEAIKRGPRTKEFAEGIVPEKVKASGEATIFDISKGRRDFVSAEEASELLKPLSEPGNNYKRICFSNRSFGVDAAKIAAPILSSLKDQLTEVDLSDFIAGRQEDEALEVIEIFSSALEAYDLRYLDLSNNALGEKGIRAFGALLKSQKNLEELYLMNDGISKEAAQAVCELIPSTDKLCILYFHNNMTGDEGALAISELVKHSPALKDFRCSCTRIGSEGGVALSQALGKCRNLMKLDLRDNMFGLEAGIALSKLISIFSGLTEIYLSYLNLEDEGSIALSNALKESAPSLELAENELKDEGAILIAKALKDGHGQLTEVDMSTNAIRRSGARCLAQAVVSKPGFKVLNINDNFISDEGIDEVKDIFKNSLHVLGPLDDNDPEGEDYDEEADEGADNENELETRLKGLDIKQEE
ncbi:hypothetical protein K7X08_011112 [Anisodus acutangulus]|uniref:Uncharacterized protein n=1 Tax=Anisodus acutangulus TaxID=402998 RepID=A0A9Q1M1J5_9SOLA|nr:hypothetical protein K7X08_011112 [Anisodus acutangulus]